MSGYRRIAETEMASTGNDLVFLPATRSAKTCQPRFYCRILTAAEQQLYARHESLDLPFDQYVWLCWSVKESVYKYHKRLYPGVPFAPLQIGISGLMPPSGSEEFYRCTARFPTARAPLYSRSSIRDGVIMTIVSQEESFADTRWGCRSIGSNSYADQSAAVRTLVLSELQTLLSRTDLELGKDADGCPILLGGGRPLAIPVSLAHHENWIAYSFRYDGRDLIAASRRDMPVPHS